MSNTTVQLDDEAEAILGRLHRLTGLSMAELLTRGLRAYEEQAVAQVQPTPYQIYQDLDLGPGGYARAPARAARSAVGAVIRHKHER